MEIIQETYDMLKKLSKVNFDYFNFVEKNPEGFKRSTFSYLDTGNYSYKIQAWPIFISHETREMLRDVSVKILDLIKCIPVRVFANDYRRMASYFMVTEDVMKLQLEGISEDLLANLIGRADLIVTNDWVKCIEFNVSANCAGWYLPEWESLNLNAPFNIRFREENGIKVYNENYSELFMDHCIRFASSMAEKGESGDLPELNTVLVIKGYNASPDAKNTFLDELRYFYSEKLVSHHLTGNIYIGDYEHIQYADNMVYLNGKRIHLVVELLHGVVSAGVMKSFCAGNVKLLNGPVTGLFLNKFTMAVLSENEDSSIFTPEERETIRKHIPWTRKIIPCQTTYKGEKVNLEEFLISNKNKMVIKSAVGLAGQQVYIGQGMFNRDWENLVKSSLRKGTLLAQELVEAPRSFLQMGEEGTGYFDTVWGVWILGSQFAGSFVRVLPGGNARKVVNGGQGAAMGITLEVDE